MSRRGNSSISFVLYEEGAVVLLLESTQQGGRLSGVIIVLYNRGPMLSGGMLFL